MKRYLFAVLALLCMLASALAPVGIARAEQELIVSAAASLTNAFGEMTKKFESANPGIKVVCNFASSGALLQQIDKGAPADVFASADQKTLDQAAEKKLILTDTRKNFAGNELLLIVPAQSKLQLKTLKDLLSKPVGKVSIGNPDSVPAGRYAKEVLTNEGLWNELQPKYIMAESVRQVLDYVSRGEVDAGFVYSTDAVVAGDKVKVALEASNHKPISYPIAIVSSTKKKDAALRFVDFVLSKEGREVLAKYGFKNP